MSNTSIITSVGQLSVNNAVVPYMREREVEFYAQNLRPGRAAQFFFGDINVTRFVQTASQLIPDTANANDALASVIDFGERFYCNTTHAFVTAIGAANGTIYLNENYVVINVAPLGANNFSSTDYNTGDIVFQTYQPVSQNGTVSNVSFEATVVYWNSSDGVLALEPIIGALTAANATLYKSGEDLAINVVSEIYGNKFPLNGLVSSLDNVSNQFLVNTYNHNGGVVINSVAAPNSNCVTISGNITSNLVGELIFLTAGSGLGQGAQILAVGNNYVYTNTAFNPVSNGNTYYSFGSNYVDETGHIFGVFNIPETQTVKFASGAQKFTITDSIIVDDPNATMVATATYVAQGYLSSGTNSSTIPVVQPPQYQQPNNGVADSGSLGSGVVNQASISAVPGPNTTYAGFISSTGSNQWPWSNFGVDPIAQTFTTPIPAGANNNYGIFVSSVDLWFNSIPQGDSPKFPVQVLICETNNGVPVPNVLAISSVQFEDIQVSSTPDSINIGGLSNNNSTITKFKFDDPVYLQPGTTYAMVVYTESPDYEVYLGQIGSSDISNAGGGIRRISSQPDVGTLFKSQNAGAWIPHQNQFLMFVLNKAVFSTNPVSLTFNGLPFSTSIIPYDKLLLSSSDLNFPVCDLTYKVQTILANTFAPDTYTEVTPGKTLNWSADLKTSNFNSTRRRILIPGNTNSILVQVSMQTQNPDVSPVLNNERLSTLLTTYVVNAGGIESENITVTNGGNHINAANIVVTIGPPDLSDGTQATANVPALNGNSVPVILVTYPGSGYSVAPSITISEPGAPVNATAVITGENSPSGGNGLARYITKKVTLANGMAAGDLRVYLNCIRPAGTDVLVYYKVLSPTDIQSFNEVPWQEMTLVNNINSPDQTTQIQLQYCPSLGPNGLPSGILSYTYNGIQYPLGGTFQYFAIKIVLFADDASVVPSVQSLQAIALPGG